MSDLQKQIEERIKWLKYRIKKGYYDVHVKDADKQDIKFLESLNVSDYVSKEDYDNNLSYYISNGKIEKVALIENAGSLEDALCAALEKVKKQVK